MWYELNIRSYLTPKGICNALRSSLPIFWIQLFYITDPLCKRTESLTLLENKCVRIRRVFLENAAQQFNKTNTLKAVEAEFFKRLLLWAKIAEQHIGNTSVEEEELQGVSDGGCR
jgi:hypothetical protein